RQNLLRQIVGCALRKEIISFTKRKISECLLRRSPFSQVVSLSWLDGLLFPPWVCRNSSPAANIGIPLESNSRVKKFFAWRFRRATTSGVTSSSPSNPQFQL